MIVPDTDRKREKNGGWVSFGVHMTVDIMSKREEMCKRIRKDADVGE